MDNERSSFINIGGEEYELILTTRATKEDKLLKNKNFEIALGEIVWLITLLANQSILIHNLKNRDEKKPLLTEEDVELLTVPSDLAEYKAAITEAMYKGTKRNIESEEDSKNTAAG